MTPDPETNEEVHDNDTQHDDERPNPHGKDPDSPGATIDDAEPAEPNEPA